MTDSDKNIDSLLQLVTELKKYFLLQRDYVQLHLTIKLILLLSALMLTFIVMVLGGMLVFHCSCMAVYWLAPYVGGVTAGHAVIVAVLLLLSLGVYLFRKQLVVRPISRFVSHLLLK